jgi:hypothetical protein
MVTVHSTMVGAIRVKRSIKGAPRKSRTEAFLEYVESHPREELAAADDRTDALIRALEQRQRTGNPRRGAANPESPQAAYERTHWGQAGRVTKPRPMHVPDPRAGPLVILGQHVIEIVYATDKGDGLEEFRHTFGRAHRAGTEHGPASLARCPVLAFNKDGLVIAGGQYAVETGGIVG